MFNKEIITLFNQRNSYIRKVNQDYRNGKDQTDGICADRIKEIRKIESSLKDLDFEEFTGIDKILDELEVDEFDVSSVTDIPLEILDVTSELPYKEDVEMSKLSYSLCREDRAKLVAIAKSRNLTVGELVTYCLEKRYNNGEFDVDVENKLKLKTTSYSVPSYLNIALQNMAKNNAITKNSIVELILKEELNI